MTTANLQLLKSAVSISVTIRFGSPQNCINIWNQKGAFSRYGWLIVNGIMTKNQLISCKSEDCNRLVYPDLEQHTGNLCLACFQKYGFGDFPTATNAEAGALEQIKGKFQTKGFDPFQPDSGFKEIEIQLMTLSAEQQKELAAHCLDLMQTDLPRAEDLAAALACFCSQPQPALTEAFFERRRYYPCQLYRFATKHMFREIKERITWDSRSRRSLLAALAQMPFEQVPGVFAGLNAEPPEWASVIGMGFRSWTHLAGWEWTYDEGRRQLYSPACFPLISDPNNPIEAATDSPIDCGFCQKPLVLLYRIDADQYGVEEFSGIISALTCEDCGRHSTIFTEWDESGVISWPAYNHAQSPPKPDPKAPRINRGFGACLGGPAHILRATYPKFPVKGSQIGGLPTLLNRPQYPICPICDETMRFFGQLAANVLGLTHVGLFQTFTCTDCRVAATLFHHP